VAFASNPFLINKNGALNYSQAVVGVVWGILKPIFVLMAPMAMEYSF
jgi:hypothetical protein